MSEPDHDPEDQTPLPELVDDGQPLWAKVLRADNAELRVEMLSYRSRLAELEREVEELRKSGVGWLVYAVQRARHHALAYLRDIDSHDAKPMTRPPGSRAT